MILVSCSLSTSRRPAKYWLRVMVSEAAKVTQEDISYEMDDGRQLPVTVAFKNDILVIQTTTKQELLPFDGISSELVAVYNVGEMSDDVLSRLRGQGEPHRSLTILAR